MEIILHDEVQLMDWGESRVGGPWIKFRLRESGLLDIFRGMDTVREKKTGHIFHITIASGDIAALADGSDKAEPAGQYGHEAYQLRASGFFRMPVVWREIGSDDEYLDWLESQPCAARALNIPTAAPFIMRTIDGSEISAHRPADEKFHCDGDVVAAHVRRISAGAGIGIKPLYSAIPLCDYHHKLQHNHGESVLGGKEWFDRQFITHVEQWAWQTLKLDLGSKHWRDIEPRLLYQWAAARGIADHLPPAYRGAA